MAVVTMSNGLIHIQSSTEKTEEAKQVRQDETCDVMLLGRAIDSARPELLAKPVKAHRDVLACSGSRQLRELFSVKGDSRSEQRFPNITQQALERIVSYIYTGKQIFPVDAKGMQLLKQVLSGADALEFKELKDGAEQGLITVTNTFVAKLSRAPDVMAKQNILTTAGDILVFAVRYACPELKALAFQYILAELRSTKNVEITPSTADVLALTSDHIKCLLKSLANNAESQIIIILNWIEHNVTDRRKHAEELLGVVDLTRLSTNVLTELAQDDRLVEPSTQGAQSAAQDILKNVLRTRQSQK